MDKIIRFENLNEGVNEVFEVLLIDRKLLAHIVLEYFEGFWLPIIFYWYINHI